MVLETKEKAYYCLSIYFSSTKFCFLILMFSRLAHAMNYREQIGEFIFTDATNPLLLLQSESFELRHLVGSKNSSKKASDERILDNIR